MNASVNTAYTVCILLGWNTNYAALLEYYKEHGTCNVPRKGSYECDLEGLGEDGGVYHYMGNLGVWLCNQRQARNGQGNRKITPKRQALLQKLVDEGMCMCMCVCFSFHHTKFM